MAPPWISALLLYLEREPAGYEFVVDEPPSCFDQSLLESMARRWSGSCILVERFEGGALGRCWLARSEAPRFLLGESPEAASAGLRAMLADGVGLSSDGA